MTWHQKLICTLVLLLARMVARIAGEEQIEEELKAVANHISVSAPKELPGVLLRSEVVDHTKALSPVSHISEARNGDPLDES